jgi:hypothetical protein
MVRLTVNSRFHTTSCTLNLKNDDMMVSRTPLGVARIYFLSKYQVKKLKKALCGREDCYCMSQGVSVAGYSYSKLTIDHEGQGDLALFTQRGF